MVKSCRYPKKLKYLILQVPKSLNSSEVPRSHKNPNCGHGSKFRLGAMKLCRAVHDRFPPLDVLSSIYQGFSLSGGINFATFGFCGNTVPLSYLSFLVPAKINQKFK